MNKKRIARHRKPRYVSLVTKAATTAIAAALLAAGCSTRPHPAAASRPATGAARAPRLGAGAAKMATTPYDEATAAAAALQGWYNGRSYRSAHWWQSAIALSAVIGYMQASGTWTYVGDLAETYRAFHNTGDFTRNYYDDEGWWALAWAQAYGLTRDQRYLRESEHIFADMTRGWDSTCGGGLPWSKKRHYKNAITNALFLDVAATLHNLIPGDHVYGRWAAREWRWFRATGMLTKSRLVVDGLSGCQPLLNSTTWTYNQGVLIGALVALSQMTGGRGPLATAEAIAGAVIASPTLSPDGILREPCEPASCDTDGTIFKGVFAQNLGILEAAAPSAAYEAYLRRNAESVWDNDRQGDRFGLRWAGPFAGAGAGQQVSALAILTTQITAPGI